MTVNTVAVAASNSAVGIEPRDQQSQRDDDGGQHDTIAVPYAALRRIHADEVAAAASPDNGSESSSARRLSRWAVISVRAGQFGDVRDDRVRCSAEPRRSGYPDSHCPARLTRSEVRRQDRNIGPHCIAAVHFRQTVRVPGSPQLNAMAMRGIPVSRQRKMARRRCAAPAHEYRGMDVLPATMRQQPRCRSRAEDGLIEAPPSTAVTRRWPERDDDLRPVVASRPPFRGVHRLPARGGRADGRSLPGEEIVGDRGRASD